MKYVSCDSRHNASYKLKVDCLPNTVGKQLSIPLILEKNGR